MSSNKKPDRPMCRAITSVGRPCHWRAFPGYELCANHEPALAETRTAYGRIRHPRFRDPVTFAGAEFDRKDVPPIGKLVNSLLDVADQVRNGTLDPSRANAFVAATRAAVSILSAERERRHKKDEPLELPEREPDDPPPPPTLEELLNS